MAQKWLENTEFQKVGLNSYERAPDRMAHPHRHNEIEFVYVKNGTATYLFGGTRLILRPKALAIFWSGVPHQVVAFNEKCVLSGLEIPLAWYLQWKLPDQLTRQLLNGKILQEADPAQGTDDGPMISRWHKDLGAKREELKRAVLLEVEARLWRFADAHPEEVKEASAKQRGSKVVLGEGGLDRVERMAQFIAENYTRSIHVEDIAAAVDLHPNYAMKVFHKTFGTHLPDYVTQHRVAHAQRLLSTSDMKIMDIALESGFGSLSRFNANFKEFAELSPSAYRRKMKPKS